MNKSQKLETKADPRPLPTNWKEDVRPKQDGSKEYEKYWTNTELN